MGITLDRSTVDVYGMSMQSGKRASALAKATVLSILEAADRVRRHFQQILERRGLTLQQYNVLRILRGAGKDGLPTLEVGERMIEKTPGVTRLLDRLEEKGYVRRNRSRDDRRLVLCHLTKAGLALLAELDEPIAEGDRTCIERLTQAEQRQLGALSSRIGP